ncbi:hypothetical protein [Mycolicibacterium grossiae]|uniref:hypothetical protein n=1 Tax=Mycolicibacterium grossiae TaxID=1552759 RepID=UPI000F7B8CC3|nr:hypothetical protein [Mycolicibacterium grossiae]
MNQKAVKRSWRFILEHPVWVVAGALAAICAIFIPFLAVPSSPLSMETCNAQGENIRVDCSRNEMVESTPASLEVGAFDVGEPTEIDASLRNAADPSDPPREIRLPTTPADVTLKNNGTMTSLITQIEAEVLFSSELADCASAGAGPAMVSAFYSVKIPGRSETDGSLVPGLHMSETRFEVKPNSVDRMAISIGPEDQSYSSVRPVVIVARLALIHDQGNRLELGTVAVVTSDDAEFQMQSARDEQCAADNLDVLEDVYAIQAVRSAELDRLRAKYEDLAYI